MSIMNPSKFSGYSPDGRRTMNFGGGGGGGGQSQRDATPEERRLWAAQAGSLESISSAALPNLVTGMNNLGTMANESMDGTLSKKLKGMASADANQSASMAVNAAGRTFDRYGSTLNPNAHASIIANAGLDFARTRTNAMNQANMGVEDIKWNRNAALTGLASGQGASAVSGMGSLAGQIGQNRQASMQADSQANQGLGMMGAMVGSKMFADGGAVTREPRFADGGGLRMYRPQGMPTTNPMQFGNSTDSDGPSQAGAFLAPMASMAAMNYGAKNLLKPAVEAGGKWLAGQAGTAVEAAGLGSTQAGAPVSTATASTAAVDAASAEAAVASAGEAAVADAAAAAAAEAAAAEAAAELAMLVVLKDGGGVDAPKGLRRKDMTPGGAVSGPGTATSDSVPARLSDGEFVENADAVKLPRSDTKQIVAEWAAGGGGSTRDLLKNINDAGLEKRYGDRRPAAAGINRSPASEVEMAGGGLLSTLGQMAHGYVPMAMAADERAESRRRYDERLGLERATHAQTAELRGLQIENARMTQEDAARDRADKKAIMEGGSAAIMPEASVTSAGLRRAPAPAMSMSPDAPASAVDSLVPQSVATQPRQAGLKNTNDTREDDRLFSASKGMYETALRLNRPDLAAGYYQQMTQNRDTLMARANDRADRVFRSTGNISGYVDSYNRYLADGNTIDAFKQNDDGSHTLTLNDGSGKPRDVNVPKERIGEYLMALRDPKRVREIESRRADMLFKAQTEESLPSNQAKTRKENAVAGYYEGAKTDETQARAAAAQAKASGAGGPSIGQQRWDAQQALSIKKNLSPLISFDNPATQKREASIDGEYLVDGLLASGYQPEFIRDRLYKLRTKYPDPEQFGAAVRQVIADLKQPPPPPAPRGATTAQAKETTPPPAPRPGLERVTPARGSLSTQIRALESERNGLSAGIFMPTPQRNAARLAEIDAQLGALREQWKTAKPGL